jgi:histidinol-phosphate aminotransferase
MRGAVEMLLKISKPIQTGEKLSYAKEDTHVPDGIVDCSAGYNPYGAPPAVLEALRNLDSSVVYKYPHGMLLYDAIIDFWRPNASLKKENILLTDGSIGGIYLINTAFATPGAAVLAFSPQFSDYITHAQFMNIEYRPVRLDARINYRIEAESLLEAIDDSLSLIYLDNPNNPTGQAISLEIMRAVLDKAARHNVCVIADEAYADFMEETQSAATLLAEYENLAVLRTFSKGLGLAGFRAGYLLAHESICGSLSKISNPYVVSQPARIAAMVALTQRDFVKDCRIAIAQSKSALRQALGKNLSLACTLDTCPICLISHVNTSVDLEQEFFRRGVLTYSGLSFDGLGKNSVRLRVPHQKECETLLAAVRELDM